tara:strand:- start:352 stop:1131 length:780 start_codon:yes stop_codon:yes gene_type:complete
MKKIIKKLFHIFGLNISRIPPNFTDTDDFKKLNFNDIHQTLIKKQNPTIFDVGANKGQTIIRFKKLFPDSKIHAFEPIEKEFLNLKSKFKNDNSVILNNYALGENEEEKDFYITANSGNSSFYKLNPNTKWLKIRSKQFNTDPEKFTSEIKKVKIKTLDNYCKNNNVSKIDILKIDCQGYEDKVLMGSSKMLVNKSINIIETELMFDDIYERHLSFYDIEKYLIKNNFRLIALEPMNFKNLLEGYMFSVDAIYINNDNK